MMNHPLIVSFAVITSMMVEVTAGCRDSGNPSESKIPPKTENTDKPIVILAKSAESGYTDSWDRSIFDHGLWDQVLQQFVDDHGLVDYAGIAHSKAFDEYLYRLSRTDPAGLKDDKERLAFWINAYNALMIRALLDVLPKDQTLWPDFNVHDVKVKGQNIWKGLRFVVGDRRWSLDEIENEILRKKTGLRDPRIHVSLVCGARGCPPLWRHAYVGGKINAQLLAALQRFIGNPHQCVIQVDRGRIKISQVFQWYRDDFVSPAFSPHAESIPAFLALGVEDPAIAQALKTRTWQLTYFDYDWTINVKR